MPGPLNADTYIKLTAAEETGADRSGILQEDVHAHSDTIH
jgi:hypothetical protein